MDVIQSKNHQWKIILIAMCYGTRERKYTKNVISTIFSDLYKKRPPKKEEIFFKMTKKISNITVIQQQYVQKKIHNTQKSITGGSWIKSDINWQH